MSFEVREGRAYGEPRSPLFISGKDDLHIPISQLHMLLRLVRWLFVWSNIDLILALSVAAHVAARQDTWPGPFRRDNAAFARHLLPKPPAFGEVTISSFLRHDA